MDNKSEVARLTAQITAEYEAGQAALHGLAAGTARHDFISARMESMEVARQALVAQVGEETAKPLIIAAMGGDKQ